MPDDVDGAPERERLTRRQQFSNWNRDPNLWRDVYGKVVSALIIAVIGYGIGVTSGYIRPRQREVYGVVDSVLALVAIVIAAKRGADTFGRWANSSEKRSRRAWNLIWAATVIFGALAIWQSWSGRA